MLFSVYASTILRKGQCILQTVYLYFQMYLSSEFLNPARQGGGGGGGVVCTIIIHTCARKQARPRAAHSHEKQISKCT